MKGTNYQKVAREVFDLMEAAGPLTIADRVSAAFGLLRMARAFTLRGLMTRQHEAGIRAICEDHIRRGLSPTGSRTVCEKAVFGPEYPSAPCG